MGINRLLITNKAEWRNWQTWRLTVNEIENLVGLDFFSNILNNVEEIIEADMGPVIPLASLLADPELTAVYPTTTVNNDTIRHNGIKEGGSWATTNSLKNGIFEISASQVGVVQSSENHTRPPQISVRELDGSKISHFQVSASQVGIGQIGTTQFSLGQISTAQIGSSQINVSQASSGQVSSTEVNTAQNILGGVVVRDISNPQNSPTQVNSREISLPFLVTPVQFFNIHNSIPVPTNTYKDNLPILWSTLFDPTNPFDLTLQIKDLPTGQLAEAKITKFDQYGRPNGGTILKLLRRRFANDNDANVF